MDALFRRDGDALIPTELARGPWDPGALHGGPTAAAVTGAAEAHLSTEADWQVARLTLELLRPVPVEPLVLGARTVRPGRKVTLVEVGVTVGGDPGREVARGVVLAVRRAPLETPVRHQAPPDTPEGLPTGEQPAGAGQWEAFHNRAVEMRFARGDFAKLGPSTVWMRLRCGVIEGEAVSAAARAAALADFGNGISSELEFGAWRFLNPELTLHLARPPEGEWIRLDARTVVGDAGAGLATSELADRSGSFGRAVQALLIERA